MTIIIIVIAIVVASSSIWYYAKLRHQYWQRRGIPHLKPTFLFGNAYSLCFGSKSMLEYMCDMYDELKSVKLLGVYMFYKPTLYIGDVEWIDNILHRDFRYFFDRGLKLDADNEPLTKHLFHLEGGEWKTLRVKIMPAFMPQGLKSLFFPKLLQSCSKLKAFLDDVLTREKDLDLKDILSRYASDVIGLCAFGTDSGALTRGNTDFYRMSMRTVTPRVRTLFKLILPNLPNFLADLFDIKVVETRLTQYFADVVRSELKKRRQHQEDENNPNDFPAFMMELQKENSDITDDTIMAHCFMFFIAGFENATGNCSMALLELADHPEIQEKLFEEIENTCVTSSGMLDITFDKLNEMKYLDMVVCETLRLYPPATALIRECTERYKLPGSDYTIEKGTQIVIPFCGINRDPRYYPYANEFNPENFSDEARAKRTRSVFIPFGDGPRMCLGRRFGTAQIKLALIVLVHNFVFHPSPKMARPLKFEPQVFITSVHGGVWVRATPRIQKVPQSYDVHEL